MGKELKKYLDAMEARRVADMERLETRLVEKMRDIQTELLRGFASFSQAQTIRLRKVELAGGK
jgi:hypothetical protein